MTKQESKLEDGFDRLQKFRIRRLKQLAVATEITYMVIAVHRAMIGAWDQVIGLSIPIMLIYTIFPLMKREKINLAVTVLLSVTTLSITFFMWQYEGLKDEVVLIYPAILIFSALLGSQRLTAIILLFVICNIMAVGYVNWASIHSHISGTSSLDSAVLIAILLLLIGYSIWLLSSDLKRLLEEISRENNLVLKSQEKIEKLLVNEKKLRATEEEFHKLQKIENLGVLAGGIAHDFNNVLTGIFGNLSLAKMKLSKDHPVYGYLDKSENSIDRATRLTKQLLTFAKGGEPVKEEVDVTYLIEETTLFDLSGSNVKPRFNFPNDPTYAQVDKGQIQQVISNLVINADQAMPEGGVLDINVEKVVLEQQQVKRLEAGSYIKIDIQDEGTGIRASDLDKIFDPYYTTKEKGSGLGLTTVFSILKRHGGTINIESEPEKGACFTLYLPLLPTQPTTEIAILNETPEEPQKNKILVMDDDLDILDLITALLEVKGFVATKAVDGVQMLKAYQLALENAEPFDAVIMDLTIPGGMGGKDAITELLKIDGNANCIVSSGYADDPIMANYSDYGFKAALSKPYVLDELNKTLISII
ncbi:MAG: hypothetical protein DRQ47_03890 [Gammaproteobacteria bacterium]|nr:MAG: hypothetical protein DRQ47_03890 [Gammaproteobacteria bacterium]